MDETPRDTHRDLPRDIRHDWQYTTFRQLEQIMDERDKRYEERFKGLERTISHSLIALLLLGFLAAMLLIATLVVFLSGHVH